MTRRTSPGRRHDESGVVAPARVMLVAIVLVAIAAATYVAGLGSGSSTSEADTATPASTRETPSASASSPSSPSASATTPAPSASASASRRPSPSATAKPKATSTPAPSVERGDVSVSVFNNSSRAGLAARTSGKVKAAGWKVIGTDNWYGSIPQPTVYYPASLKAAAELLAEDAGIDRVKPAVSPMRNDRLTLIVTAGYRL